MVHALSLEQTADTATIVERTKLALRFSQSRVLRVTRVRFDAADRRHALEKVVLVLDHFSGLAPNDGDVPDIIDLAERYDLSLGRATERISIVPATKDVAVHLGIAVGANVMKLDRIVETAGGEPIEWRIAYRKA
jgi:DNA-binding GntR family transcriptional regulator